jgi:hypothetical protein
MIQIISRVVVSVTKSCICRNMLDPVSMITEVKKNESTEDFSPQ